MSSQYYSVTARVGVPHRHEVEVTIPLAGPAGPTGPAGTGLDTLTVQGDILYRGASSGQRLPIGTAGQVLKVNSTATAPEWAAPAATGVTSVALASTDLTITGSPITSAGTITANIGVNAVSLEKLQTIQSAHLLGRHGSGNGDVQSVGVGTGLAIVGGTVAVSFGSSAGTASEGNHTHGNLTNDGKLGFTAGLPLVTTTAGAVTTLALGTAGQVLKVNSGATGVEFAADAGGVTTVNSTLADILSVSGSDLVADDLASDKLYGWDDSESKAIGFTIGSGLSVSGDTLSATASGGSKTYAVFTAEHNQPPSTAFATLDTRNSIAVLDFDDATDESAVFVSIIPEGASLGSGLKIRLHWMATTATSGNVVWDVSLERMTTDLDSDSFDTIASGTAAANGTSGILTVTEITLTTIDSVTAGDGYRLKVTRDANNASDTMTGDAELVACEVRSAA